jgi:hypothetical protein
MTTEHKKELTLEEYGTPWAKMHFFSEDDWRPTGHLATQPPRNHVGTIRPGWEYVGEMTKSEFDERVEKRNDDS